MLVFHKNCDLQSEKTVNYLAISCCSMFAYEISFSVVVVFKNQTPQPCPSDVGLELKGTLINCSLL